MDKDGDKLIESDGLRLIDKLGDKDGESETDTDGLNDRESDGEREMDKEGDDTSRASVVAYSLPYSSPYIHIYLDYLKHKNNNLAVPVGLFVFVHVIVNPSASKLLKAAV